MSVIIINHAFCSYKKKITASGVSTCAISDLKIRMHITHSDVFKIMMISYHCHHPLNNAKSGDLWKSPMKIMLLNVSFICCSSGGCGINNLWNHQKLPCSTRVNWSGLWISLSLLMCLLAVMPICEARPSPATAPRATRHFFLGASVGPGGTVSHKLFNSDTNGGSSDNLSLSIFSPLDILRQNMLLEIQRKRFRHAKQQQVQLNKEYLDRIGR